MGNFDGGDSLNLKSDKERFSLLSSVVLSICFAIAYFPDNRLTEWINEDVIQRTYDQLEQIATLTSSLGANLTYERNEFGELLNFKARQGEAKNHFVSEHQYDSLGFELKRLLPGGVSQSFVQLVPIQ